MNNHPANGPLTVERITCVRELLQHSLGYQNGGDMAYVIADAVKGLEELLECRRQSTNYHAAIDLLRTGAANELDNGCRAHHNALIFAANVLENAQAFGAKQ